MSPTKSTPISPSFQTAAEKDAWVLAHADRFTICRFKGAESPSRFDRKEVATLERAREVAEEALREDPTARLIVYALAGVLETYVETIKRS